MNATNNSSGLCDEISATGALKCVLSGLLVLTDLVFLGIIARNWQGVSQNFANVYAANVLLNSFVLALAILSNTATDFTSKTLDDGYNFSFKAFQQSYYLCLVVSLTWSMFFLSCGARSEYLGLRLRNVTAIRRPSIERPRRSSIQSQCNREKKLPLLAILLSWTIPILLSVIVVAGWRCNLASSDRNFSSIMTLLCDFNDGCPSYGSLLTSSFLILILCCWFFGYVFAFGVLLYTVRDYVKSRRGSPSRTAVVWVYNSLNSAFKGTSVAIGLSFAVNLPVMILIGLETSTPTVTTSTALGVTEVLLCVYLLVLPFILTAFFPGLRMAGAIAVAKYCVRRREEPIITRNPLSPDEITEEDRERLIALAWITAGPTEKTPQVERGNPFDENETTPV